MNWPAVEAGLTILKAGGDFTDDIVVYEGKWLGGELFVSFDKKAIKSLKDLGYSVHLLK